MSLEEDSNNDIISNKHSAARSAAEQAANCGAQFKDFKQKQKKLTFKNEPSPLLKERINMALKKFK